MSAPASYEAIGRVRKRGAIGAFESRWLTVPTDDRAAAVAAFNALGYECNGVSIHPQDHATQLAQAAFP